MKTTIDLPDVLVRQLKLRAVHERRKLKDLAADLLRSGLAAPSPPSPAAHPLILKDRKTGLPVIQCRGTATPAPEQVARILADQEIAWTHEPA